MNFLESMHLQIYVMCHAHDSLTKSADSHVNDLARETDGWPIVEATEEKLGKGLLGSTLGRRRERVLRHPTMAHVHQHATASNDVTATTYSELPTPRPRSYNKYVCCT
uniref:Uncharacterized protein n=1 Tax=Eutreptiella gymnastica TaxID=73025 RepID=A0A7S4FWX8_9EUGL|mmetsp:Transcript_106198/g.179328  ORF Transcript_106198/g.179328 Transcript_106198/m.179328 type:complete len:108 (-) Transcript_106198:331-654(-)